MISRQDLEFPAPAGELWVENRDTIATALDQLGTEYKIGGGTVLAARWKHRCSYDIDLLVPEGTRLGDLDDHGFHWFHEAMENHGAVAEYSSKLNFVNFRFDTGTKRREIQIWAHEPTLNAGHAPEPVCGRTETLLSNAQILRGKLQRSEKKLCRDVYDVLKAREIDPEQLEIAVSTMRHEEVSSIVSDWLHSRETIVRHADTYLRQAVEAEVDYRNMAVDAAFALIDSRYERFRIAVDRNHIIAEAITEGGAERFWKIQAADAEKQFASLGIENRLRGKGPGADAIREYATQLCQKDTDRILVYEEHNDEPVRWRTAKRSYNLKTLIPERPRATDAWSSERRQERTWWSR